MPHRALFLFALSAGLLTFAPEGQAQLNDLINSIAGDGGFESDAQFRYFNRENCGLGGTGGSGGTGGGGGDGGSGGIGGSAGAGGMGGGGSGGMTSAVIPLFAKGSAGGSGDSSNTGALGPCQCDGSAGTGGDGGSGGMGGTGAGGDGGMSGAGGDTFSEGGTVDEDGRGMSPETTDFSIRLQETGTAITEVFLWVGGQNSGCNVFENRNETRGQCAEVPGNPRSVANNFEVGLFLEDLLVAQSGSTQIVSCETSGLRGTPYELFVFRNSAPGADDVDGANYGVAPFFVDVVPPNLPLVDMTPLRQEVFQIRWGEPDPPDDIQTWRFFCSCDPDPATAIELDFFSNLERRSTSIAAETIGLDPDADPPQTAYVFMSAFDQAFVSERTTGGNESGLTQGVPVTAIRVDGFCSASGDCTGCAASRFEIGNGHGPGPVFAMLGLLIAFGLVRRLRR